MITNIDTDPRPDMILMAYDNPARANNFRYKVGFNLDANGVTGAWAGFPQIEGVGWEGAGLGIGNVNGDARPDLFFMAYDNPARDNSFRYWMFPDAGAAQPIWLEMDKLSSVAWPPASANRNGRLQSLRDIYLPVGADVDVRQHNGDIRDPLPSACFSDADLDVFMSAHVNFPPLGGAWHMHAGFVTCSPDDLLGIMFDAAQRRGFAVFMNALARPSSRSASCAPLRMSSAMRSAFITATRTPGERAARWMARAGP